MPKSRKNWSRGPLQVSVSISLTQSLSLSHTYTYYIIYITFTYTHIQILSLFLSLTHTFIKCSQIFMEYRGSNSLNSPGHVQDRFLNFFYHSSDPWFISFRSSYKSSQSVNPLKTRSGDRRTDKVRTIASFPKGKCAKNLHYRPIF